jgi:hypothetical protein
LLCPPAYRVTPRRFHFTGKTEWEISKRFQGYVEFEVYPPAVVKISSAFWDITPFCPLKVLCLPASITLVYRLAYSLT